MKVKILWFIQLLVNEYVMLKLVSYVCSFLPFKVEDGWSIVIEGFLIIAFLFVGYGFTEVIKKNKK